MRAINQEMQREWEDIRAEFIQKKSKEWSKEVDRKLRGILAGTIFKPGRFMIGMGSVSLSVYKLDGGKEVYYYDVANECTEEDFDQYHEVRSELEGLVDDMTGPTCDYYPFPMEYVGEYGE